MATRSPKLALAFAVLCLTSVAAIGGPSAFTASLEGDGTQPVHAHMSTVQVDRFTGFELYWLGARHEDLDLHATVRQVTPAAAGEPSGRDSVDFLYGDCDASAGSCPFPLEVQIWPACLRNRSSYEIEPGVSYPSEALTIRGVPAATFDDGQRLELYTGTVTVVIFSDSEERLLPAAHELQGVGDRARAGATIAAGQPLPAPAPGALDGTLACRG